MRFKTKREKLIHHNILEPECKNERNNLIKLIAYFKRCLFNLYKAYNLTEEDLMKDPDYVCLKEKYLETEKKLLDTEYFYEVLGANFSDMPIILDD